LSPMRRAFSQGKPEQQLHCSLCERSFLATLGFIAESLWDSALGATGVLTLLLSLFFAPALFAAETQKFPTLELGATAPDFKLPGADGKKYALKDFKKSPILIVVFTCNHCPTAQYYEERLKKMVEDYKAKGVALV